MLLNFIYISLVIIFIPRSLRVIHFCNLIKMKLHVNLLHKIHKKLKQPCKDINLELSYSLNHQEGYYIDSYLKYYLIKFNKYNIWPYDTLCFHSELNVVKYVIKKNIIHISLNDLIWPILMKDFKVLKYISKYIVNFDSNILILSAILCMYKIRKFLLSLFYVHPNIEATTYYSGTINYYKRGCMRI